LHKAPAPVITAEAIKMQRGNSLDKFHREISKLDGEVKALEDKKNNISSVIDDVIKDAVEVQRQRLQALDIREEDINLKSNELKEERESFDVTSSHVRETLNEQSSEILIEKNKNDNLFRLISEKEREIKRGSDRLRSEARDLEIEKEKLSKMINRSSEKIKLLEDKKFNFDKMRQEIDEKIAEYRTQSEVLKTNREVLSQRRRDLDHKINNARTIEQSSKEMFERLQEEKAKVTLTKRHNDEMAKTIQASSKINSDKEYELGTREKGLYSKEKELNKREAYIKLKERGD